MTDTWTHTCGPGLPPPDPNDPCCDSAAYTDGRSCTCWEEVYRPIPTIAIEEGPMALRSGMCHDCAYRPDSPERRDVDGDLLTARRDQPFVCHQGMPVLRGYTHPEATFCLWAPSVHDRDDFGPIRRSDRAWKADGQLAELCAGWAAQSRVRHPQGS